MSCCNLERNLPKRSFRQGLSLIEVVCAVVLAGTVLSAVLVATGQQTRQIQGAKERIAGYEVLNDLMNRWEASSGIPRDATSGTIPGHAEWTFATSSRPGGELYDVPVEVVRVEVFRGSIETGKAAKDDVRSIAFAEVILPALEGD